MPSSVTVDYSPLYQAWENLTQQNRALKEKEKKNEALSVDEINALTKALGEFNQSLNTYKLPSKHAVSKDNNLRATRNILLNYYKPRQAKQDKASGSLDSVISIIDIEADIFRRQVICNEQVPGNFDLPNEVTNPGTTFWNATKQCWVCFKYENDALNAYQYNVATGTWLLEDNSNNYLGSNNSYKACKEGISQFHLYNPQSLKQFTPPENVLYQNIIVNKETAFNQSINLNTGEAGPLNTDAAKNSLISTFRNRKGQAKIHTKQTVYAIDPKNKSKFIKYTFSLVSLPANELEYSLIPYELQIHNGKTDKTSYHSLDWAFTTDYGEISSDASGLPAVQRILLNSYYVKNSKKSEKVSMKLDPIMQEDEMIDLQLKLISKKSLSDYLETEQKSSVIDQDSKKHGKSRKNLFHKKPKEQNAQKDLTSPAQSEDKKHEKNAQQKWFKRSNAKNDVFSQEPINIATPGLYIGSAPEDNAKTYVSWNKDVVQDDPSKRKVPEPINFFAAGEFSDLEDDETFRDDTSNSDVESEDDTSDDDFFSQFDTTQQNDINLDKEDKFDDDDDNETTRLLNSSTNKKDEVNHKNQPKKRQKSSTKFQPAEKEHLLSSDSDDGDNIIHVDPEKTLVSKKQKTKRRIRPSDHRQFKKTDPAFSTEEDDKTLSCLSLSDDEANDFNVIKIEVHKDDLTRLLNILKNCNDLLQQLFLITDLEKGSHGDVYIHQNGKEKLLSSQNGVKHIYNLWLAWQQQLKEISKTEDNAALINDVESEIDSLSINLQLFNKGNNSQFLYHYNRYPCNGDQYGYDGAQRGDKISHPNFSESVFESVSMTTEQLNMTNKKKTKILSDESYQTIIKALIQYRDGRGIDDPVYISGTELEAIAAGINVAKRLGFEDKDIKVIEDVTITEEMLKAHDKNIERNMKQIEAAQKDAELKTLIESMTKINGVGFFSHSVNSYHEGLLVNDKKVEPRSLSF